MTESGTPPSEHEDWAKNVLPKHERLAAAVHSLLENMLSKERIEFLNITSRVKNLKSALEKITRKAYAKPQTQLTDLSGIRVVTYLEGDVAQIIKIIRGLFEIDEPNSLDRGASLGSDRIGYRSTHFVCTLGKTRGNLPEYESIGGLKFEIQVRTVLQHAWAELAHDRSFKFGAALPQKIARKLNLYSGLLEIVDSAFDDISKEIDAYKVTLDQQSLTQLSVAEIDSISLAKFIKSLGEKYDVPLRPVDSANLTMLVSEIKKMKIHSIGELENAITESSIQACKNHSADFTSTGFIRTLLICADPDRYFQDRPEWPAIPVEAFEAITSIHSKQKIKKLLSRHKLRIAKRQKSVVGEISQSKARRTKSARPKQA
jgi:putative GTP pyrophosphokinase